MLYPLGHSGSPGSHDRLSFPTAYWVCKQKCNHWQKFPQEVAPGFVQADGASLTSFGLYGSENSYLYNQPDGLRNKEEEWDEDSEKEEVVV